MEILQLDCDFGRAHNSRVAQPISLPEKNHLRQEDRRLCHGRVLSFFSRPANSVDGFGIATSEPIMSW